MGAGPTAVDPDLGTAVDGFRKELDPFALPLGRRAKRLAINRPARFSDKTFHLPVSGHFDRIPFQAALVGGKILGRIGGEFPCSTERNALFSSFFGLRAQLGGNIPAVEGFFRFQVALGDEHFDGAICGKRERDLKVALFARLGGLVPGAVRSAAGDRHFRIADGLAAIV